MKKLLGSFFLFFSSLVFSQAHQNSYQENFAAFLLRHWYMNLDNHNQTIKHRMDAGMYQKLKQTNNFMHAEKTFKQFLAAHPQATPEQLAPDNIFITYDDDRFARIKTMNFVNPSFQSSYKNFIPDHRDFYDVMDYAKRFGAYIYAMSQDPKVKAQVVKQTFREIYNDSSNVMVKTMGKNFVRLAGVSTDYFYLIINEIFTFADAKGLQIKDILFFGSRVCTRAEAVRLQPSILVKAPHFIEDDGYIKDSIRVSGITAISDLQLRVFYESSEVFDLQTEYQWARELTFHLMDRFSFFPIVAKFLKEPKLATTYDNLFLALKRMYQQDRLGDTRVQYVSIKDIILPFLTESPYADFYARANLDRRLKDLAIEERFYRLEDFRQAQRELLKRRKSFVMEELKANFRAAAKR